MQLGFVSHLRAQRIKGLNRIVAETLLIEEIVPSHLGLRKYLTNQMPYFIRTFKLLRSQEEVFLEALTTLSAEKNSNRLP
jgi:hypothetical protein